MPRNAAFFLPFNEALNSTFGPLEIVSMPCCSSCLHTRCTTLAAGAFFGTAGALTELVGGASPLAAEAVFAANASEVVAPTSLFSFPDSVASPVGRKVDGDGPEGELDTDES